MQSTEAPKAPASGTSPIIKAAVVLVVLAITLALAYFTNEYLLSKEANQPIIGGICLLPITCSVAFFFGISLIWALGLRSEEVAAYLSPSKNFREVDLYAIFFSLALIAVVFPGSFEQYAGFLVNPTEKGLGGSIIYIGGIVISLLLSILYAFTPRVPSRFVANMMVYFACAILAAVSVLAVLEEGGQYIANKEFVLGLFLLILPVLAAIRAAWLFARARGGSWRSRVAQPSLFVFDNDSIKAVVLVSAIIVAVVLAGKWIGMSALMTYLLMVESTRIVRRD